MKKCELCGTVHEAYQAHVFATNTATNKESATNTIATNAPPIASVAETKAAVGGEVPIRTPNRRSREAYNAYQREYMRRKRAAAQV